MGLFKPLNESIHDKINMNQGAKDDTGKGINQIVDKSSAADKAQYKAIHKQIVKSKSENMPKAVRDEGWKHAKRPLNAAAALLGLTDEEITAFEEGCNSDTCKCKGGTCPVKTTDGISTSSAAAKKLANAGKGNQSDLNSVTPNAEYNKQNDAFFIGDGDSPETSKTNIPAILAAKTAGGAPHGWTTDNGINGKSSDVFKLKKFAVRDDDEGPNG